MPEKARLPGTPGRTGCLMNRQKAKQNPAFPDWPESGYVYDGTAKEPAVVVWIDKEKTVQLPITSSIAAYFSLCSMMQNALPRIFVISMQDNR